MILHVDMDAFYASIEERDRPELVGKQLIVGGEATRRGVVAAANYAVRKFGVHSAMPTRVALRLCPEAIVLPVRMQHYVGVSEQVREILFRYTPLVEPLSLDEAFLDVTGSDNLFGAAECIASKIRKDIREETRLIASVGVAPNKFLAKLASDLKKPDALVVVDPQRVQEFLDPLPVGRIWGVGRATAQKFQCLGVETIEDLRSLDRETLGQHFGRWGDRFWELARGQDDRKVVPDREAKSISHETTFAMDVFDVGVLRARLQELTDQVAGRLRRHRLLGRTVRIKLRFADFQTITRSQTLACPTQTTHDLWKATAELFENNLPEARQGIRLLGMGVSTLERVPHSRQLQLFENDEDRKHGRLDALADQLQDKFGAGVLVRGSSLPTHHRPQGSTTVTDDSV